MAPVVSTLVSRRLVVLYVSLTESSSELGKAAGEIDFWVRLFYKTVTDSTSDNFSETEQRKINNY
jgi:hypothetical protein